MNNVIKLFFLLLFSITLVSGCRKDAIYDTYIDKGKVVFAGDKIKMWGITDYQPMGNTKISISLAEIIDGYEYRTIRINNIPSRLGVHKVRASYYKSEGGDLMCEYYDTDTTNINNTVEILRVIRKERKIVVKVNLEFVLGEKYCPESPTPDTFTASCEEFELTY